VTLLALLACTTPVERAGPDLVLFTVDTLRHDTLGFAGDARAQTPNMDALAARGVVFEQATTPFPRTTPALASLLTGLRPAHHGSLEVGQPMTSGVPIAVSLQQAGWLGIAASGTPVAGPEQGLDQGFQVFISRQDPRASELVQLAIQATAELPPQQSIFLWVHVVDPHFPYLPQGASEGPCKELGEKVRDGAQKRGPMFANHGGVAADALEHCKELYAAEVSTADVALGELLDGLAAQGRDPIVALSSDHGEHFGEGGLFYEHGPLAHDAVVRIPMVVAGPGVGQHRDQGVVRLEDLGVTMLVAAGLSGEGLDGVDLWPRLREEVSVVQDAAAWVLSGSALHNVLTGFLTTGRQGRRVCTHGPRWSRCGKKQSFRFFDHIADPNLNKAGEPSPFDRADLEAQAAMWPPESARELLVRNVARSLRATPVATGGHQRQGDDALGAQLDALAAELRVKDWSSVQDDGVLEGLKAMGYVE
jgi:arylsulfatase A-like enzyme